MHVYLSGSFTSPHIKSAGQLSSSIKYADRLHQLSNFIFHLCAPTWGSESFINISGTFTTISFTSIVILQIWYVFRTSAIRGKKRKSLKLRSEIQKYAQNDNLGVEKYALDYGEVDTSPSIYVIPNSICYGFIKIKKRQKN